MNSQQNIKKQSINGYAGLEDTLMQGKNTFLKFVKK